MCFSLILGQSQHETLLISNLITNQPFEVSHYCLRVNIEQYKSPSKPVTDWLGLESSPSEPEPIQINALHIKEYLNGGNGGIKD